MLGMSMRWHAAFRAARELIRSGELGEVWCIRTVLTNDSLDQPDAPDWRAERRRGGGALLEMGVHHLDLWRFLLDAEVEEVFALTQGDDESIAVAGRMQNGVPTSSLFSQRTGHVNEVEIYGDSGQLKVSPYSAPRLLRLSTRPWTFRAKLTEVGAMMSLPHAVRGRREGGFFVGAFLAEWRHFLEAVTRGGPVDTGLESGRTLLQVILAAAASTTEGRSIRCAEAPPTLAPAAVPTVSGQTR
jgi:myo-inositol 2-dehydrogenase/D-chiro-inositol 1-dehydrogenase